MPVTDPGIGSNGVIDQRLQPAGTQAAATTWERLMASNNHPEPDADADSGPSGGVQSVERALAVLEILAREGQAGVSEIAEEMGIHKSTVSRLMGSLVSRDMV